MKESKNYLLIMLYSFIFVMTPVIYLQIIKRNRYICAHCYKNQNAKYSEFFLNKDLLESLKRDLPYLLK